MSRRYWWVNQTVNFDAEIDRGRLWASTNRHGTLIKGRRSILDMAPGDIAFHYNRAAIRAVSRVRLGAQRSPRPPAYPKVDPRDPDRGWTVRVQAVDRAVNVDSAAVAQALPRGTVLDKNGQVNRQSIFELTEPQATSLADLARLSLPREESVFGRPLDELIDRADPTDAYTWSKVRLEQAALRDHLLAGAEVGTCGLCNSELPAKLLIAAHIKQRRDCTDKERRDFGSIALLLCTLGCDALFEWGYVVVGDDGVIRPGVDAAGTAVRRAVKRLSGRLCRRHDASTAGHFAARTAAVLR